jgi:hypothetical protein
LENLKHLNSQIVVPGVESTPIESFETCTCELQPGQVRIFAFSTMKKLGPVRIEVSFLTPGDLWCRAGLDREEPSEYFAEHRNFRSAPKFLVTP